MRRRTTIPLAVLVLLGAFHAFGSARAQAPARESNPDTITAVIPAFISEPPQLGMSITTILQLYIWKTLRLRSEKNRDVTFGNGKVLWDDVPPDEPTHAAAAETAIPDSAQMVLWGKAYPLPGGASVLSYLTLPAKPDRRVRQFEKWKLTFRIGDKSHEIVADVPTRQYAFEPISISDRLVDAYSRLEALSIYKTKTGNTTIGKVASTSSLFAMQWEEQAVQVKSGGKVGWLRLPHLSTTTELTAFVGGIIRIFRSDWEGAIELLSQVVYNSNTPTALQINSNLLMARAAYLPRYEATGVDPNDLRALMPRIDQWSDWCALWSADAARHEKLADEALAAGLRLTAAEAYVRAAIYYHYGKHLFADRPDEFRRAHDAMLRCYSAAAPMFDPPIERVEFPYQGTFMAGGCASRMTPNVRPWPSCCRASMPVRRSCTPGPRLSSPAASRR